MIESYFSEDIQEFICLLEKYKVKYVIVDGEAVIYYGYARFTGDIDFFMIARQKTLNSFLKPFKSSGEEKFRE